MTAESNPALILRVGIVDGQSLKRGESFVQSLSRIERSNNTFLLKIFTPFKKGHLISTFGRKSNKTDPKNFRFISASALRGFSRFKTEPIDSAAWAADEVYGSLKVHYDKEY